MTTHQKISFVKSGLRLFACVILIPVSLAASILLGGAEILGILEEVGQDYGK